MSTSSRRLLKGRNKNVSTPGKTKGDNCRKAEWKTLYCHAHSYKDPKYAEWCAQVDRINKGTQ